MLGDENKQQPIEANDTSSRNNKAALILLPPSLPARSPPSNTRSQASREDGESSSSRRVSFTLQAAPLSPRRTILASSNCSRTGRMAALEAPPSPSASNHQESLHQYLLQDPSSALTPPATGPRPLVVSARRIPQVRRQHSSKRRRRRRDATCAEEDAAAHCLWRDAGAFPRAPESSSEEEEEERLPCRANAQGYWEYCYGRGKGGSNSSIAINKNSLLSTTTVAAQTPTMRSSWSASRKPPTKGWYVTPHNDTAFDLLPA